MTRDDRFDCPPWVEDQILATRRKNIKVACLCFALVVGALFWMTLPIVGAIIVPLAVAGLVVVA